MLLNSRPLGSIDVNGLELLSTGFIAFGGNAESYVSLRGFFVELPAETVDSLIFGDEKADSYASLLGYFINDNIAFSGAVDSGSSVLHNDPSHYSSSITSTPGFVNTGASVAGELSYGTATLDFSNLSPESFADIEGAAFSLSGVSVQPLAAESGSYAPEPTILFGTSILNGAVASSGSDAVSPVLTLTTVTVVPQQADAGSSAYSEFANLYGTLILNLGSVSSGSSVPEPTIDIENIVVTTFTDYVTSWALIPSPTIGLSSVTFSPTPNQVASGYSVSDITDGVGEVEPINSPSEFISASVTFGSPVESSVALTIDTDILRSTMYGRRVFNGSYRIRLLGPTSISALTASNDINSLNPGEDKMVLRLTAKLRELEGLRYIQIDRLRDLTVLISNTLTYTGTPVGSVVDEALTVNDVYEKLLIVVEAQNRIRADIQNTSYALISLRLELEAIFDNITLRNPSISLNNVVDNRLFDTRPIQRTFNV